LQQQNCNFAGCILKETLLLLLHALIINTSVGLRSFSAHQQASITHLLARAKCCNCCLLLWTGQPVLLWR
jgi:hypothetical protein